MAAPRSILGLAVLVLTISSANAVFIYGEGSSQISALLANLTAGFGATAALAGTSFYNDVGSGQAKKDFAAGGTPYSKLGNGSPNPYTSDKISYVVSQAPLTQLEYLNAGEKSLHLPWIADTTSIYTNFGPGKNGYIFNLNADLLEKIFLLQITQWDDPELLALNPTYKKPARGINVKYETIKGKTIQPILRTDKSAVAGLVSTWIRLRKPSSVLGGSNGATTPWAQVDASNPAYITTTDAQGVQQAIINTPFSIGFSGTTEANLRFKRAGANFVEIRLPNLAGVFLKGSQGDYVGIFSDLRTQQYADLNTWYLISYIDQIGAKTYPIAAVQYIIVKQSGQFDLSAGVASTLQKWIVYITKTRRAWVAAFGYRFVPDVALTKAYANTIPAKNPPKIAYLTISP